MDPECGGPRGVKLQINVASMVRYDASKIHATLTKVVALMSAKREE